MKISVIIPAFNVAPYLVQCVNSVLNQTYPDIEIILVDDGSTDQSSEICDSLAKSSDKVSVLHKSNGGLSDARNKGIDLATGDYIVFLDSDDFWSENNALDKIVKRLCKNHPDVLCFNFKKANGSIIQKPYFQSAKSMPPETVPKESFRYLEEHDLWIACAWNKVIRKELFANEQLRFEKNVTSEDIDWCVRLALLGQSFDYMEDAVVCYRQRETSISKSITVKKVSMLLNNIIISLNLLDATPDQERAKLLKPYISYQYGTLLANIAAIEDKEQQDQLVKQAKPYQNLLAWSQNRKIKSLRLANRLVGLNGVIALINLFCKIK